MAIATSPVHRGRVERYEVSSESKRDKYEEKCEREKSDRRDRPGMESWIRKRTAYLLGDDA